MDLHVEPRPSILVNLFVEALADFEECQLTLRIAAPKGAPEEIVRVTQPERVAILTFDLRL